MKLRTPDFRLLIQFIQCFFPVVWLGFASCMQQKSNSLLPDSSAVLVKINLPEMASESIKNPELMKEFRDISGFEALSTGLDFFQPAYIFQSSDRDWSGYFFAAGITNTSKWQTFLEKQTRQESKNAGDGFMALHAPDLLCVWSDKIVLINFFRGISGPKADEEKLKDYIQAREKKEIPDPFTGEDLLSFRIHWIQNEWAGRLFDFEFDAEGKARQEGKNLVVEAAVREDSYSSMLLPFGMPDWQNNDSCGIAFALKPDIKMLRSRLKVLAMQDYFPDADAIPEAMEKTIGPFWASATGCDEESIRETFQLSAQWTGPQQSREAENWIRQQIPANQIYWHPQPENRLILSMPGVAPRKMPPFQNNNSLLFFFDIRLNKGHFRLEAGEKEQNGKFNLRMELGNPAEVWKEKLRYSIEEWAF